ncbi:glycosyl transferase family 1 [Luteococcus japonicus]|uniref:Glycosyl transferase family 1 n=1 Tax=Luteococcus japonicus TaxID=33984 RepID=A0A3N1ZX28_9ACTN|nr:glycosyltransferase [Luteococcus japonicus]ROR54702.1 glycosyl transferase family 1 [Luteococcus japonicus]
MAKPLVAWVTTRFPHGLGEQFITAEIDAWRDADARVVIVPGAMGGPARPLPEGFEVDDVLTRAWASRATLLRAAAAAMRDPALRTELADLRARGVLTRRSAVIALRAVAQARIVQAALADLAARRGTIDVAYTYWLKPHTSGAVRARDEGHVRHVISRAHGSDLYEETRPAHYNPLVRTVGAGLDCLYPISEQGCGYVQQTYGIRPERVRRGRLGTRIPSPRIEVAPGEPGEVSLLSVSSITPVKRLDLVVDAIAHVARGVEGRAVVRWRHYGSGFQQDQIERRVAEVLEPLGVRTEFMGLVPHEDLLEALAHQPVDLMLNLSSSEGVPVSIMEAQVRGIPCLATDVGATREVLGEDSPYLVPSDANAEEIGRRVLDLLEDARSAARRTAVREIVEERFDAARNFPAFVSDVLERVARP